MSDSGLLTHLSEATAGSLNGVGHSTAYEELATYSWVKFASSGGRVTDGAPTNLSSLAVKYLFLTDHGLEEHSELTVEPFNASTEQNDYEVSDIQSFKL